MIKVMKMNLKELKKKLDEQNVPTDMYSLNGWNPNEMMCIERKDQKWQVYCSERGMKTGMKIFKREVDACQYLYNIVMFCYRDRQEHLQK